MENKKNRAFTLAEILITLVVLGIVAMITIKTVMTSYTEQATVTKVRKMYNTLNQAYMINLQTKNIQLSYTGKLGNKQAEDVASIFIPYLKIAKDCGTNQTGCIYEGKYKTKTGVDRADYASTVAYRVILNDGSNIWFRRVGESEADRNRIFYDTNGTKGPNAWGKDLFYFYIKDNKVMPMGVPGSHYTFENSCSAANSIGFGCAAWLVQVGNMDYLHCEGLSLTGKHTCK